MPFYVEETGGSLNIRINNHRHFCGIKQTRYSCLLTHSVV